MPLAFYARFGVSDKAERILKCISRDYRWPDLTERPEPPERDTPFVARHAAHVLFGLAHLKYGGVLELR